MLCLIYCFAAGGRPEENLFSLLEKLAAEVNTEALPLIDLSSGGRINPPAGSNRLAAERYSSS